METDMQNNHNDKTMTKKLNQKKKKDHKDAMHGCRDAKCLETCKMTADKMNRDTRQT